MSRLLRLEAWLVERHPRVPVWLDLLGAFVSGFLMAVGAMHIAGDLL